MKNLVFLDVETTGLNGSTDRIIEIYMLKVEYSGDVAEYHSLINPVRAIPMKITEITGITGRDLQNAPFESSISNSIRSFIGDGAIVAHNLSFDLRFLEALFQRNQCAPLTGGGVDTLAISRDLFPKLCIYPEGGGSHRLKNLMYHFGLDKDYENSHRAKDDVMLLVQVYRHLEQYASGHLSYPKAVTHGCPACGSAMLLQAKGTQRELVCVKGRSCSQRLVV